MKKLLISTAIALTFSTGAFAGNLVGGSKMNNLEPFLQWNKIIEDNEIKVSNKQGTIDNLLDILEKTSYLKYCADKEGKDEWQSPKETKKRKCGDCEDIAILWYYMARERGFKPEEMNLVAGFLPEQGNTYHMILAFNIGGFEFVLDPLYLDGNIKLGSSYNENNFLVMYKINENGWGAY